jgi:hypothetical protein
VLGEKIDKKHFNDTDVFFTSKILKEQKKAFRFAEGSLYLKKMN